MRRHLLASIAALFVVSAASQLSAQTYGSVSLGAGFASQSLSGVSGGQSGIPGGQVDASTYGTTPTGPCRGWIAAAPDHMMTLGSNFSNLALEVTATDGGDTAMVVSGPSGTWCNDDSTGLNPAVVASFAAGTYSIWVASYSAEQNHPYTIVFTDRGATVPTTVPTQAPLVPGLMTSSSTPTDPMGSLNLATGFVPDPQVRSLTVTGSIDVSTVQGADGTSCRGHVMQNPNHILNLNTPFNYLRIQVRSETDTTLFVQSPNGTFLCNDDTDGFNPAISGAWTPGIWRVWVGTYSGGGSAAYSIEFSEIPR